MKSLATAAVVSIALLAAAPLVPGSASLSAQSAKTKDQPKPPRSSGGQAAPKPPATTPPPSRPAPPAAQRPTPPPQSTGEPELTRRKP